jgi:O-antigen/teichoic acid export membrane protein
MNKKFKKHRINFNWLFLEKILRVTSGLFVGILVARYLGPSDYGIFNYALAFLAFFSWLSHLGLMEILTRELTRNSDQYNELLGGAFSIKLTGALIGFLAISVIILIIKPEIEDEIVRTLIFILSFTYIFLIFNIIESYFHSKLLSKYTAISKIIGLVFSIIIKIYLIIEEYSLVYFAISNVIETLIFSVSILIFYKRDNKKIGDWICSKKTSKSLLKDSWPIMISVFLITIHLRVDQIMIEDMLTFADVGIYSVAVRLAESWYFLPGILVVTLLPYFVSLRESSKDLYIKNMVILFSYMFWLSVLIGVLTLLIGEQVIISLFGEQYVDSYGVLSINIWAGIFVAQGTVASIWQVAENLQIYRLYIQIIAVLLNISLNLILIDHIGINGAAFATLATLFFSTWIFGLFFKELRGITILMIKSINPKFLIINLRKL